MRLINGKPISDVLRLLRESKNPDKKLYGKYPYYKIGSYYERVNACFGTDHYMVEYSELEFLTIESGQECMHCKCRITLLDDEYQPIMYKEAYGGREIHYSDTTHNDDGIKNLANNTALAAFKECWKAFGIFGIRPDDENEFEQDLSGKETKASINSGSSNDYQKFLLKGENQVTIERTDSRTNLPVYKYRCKDIENGIAYDVIFYPNKYKRVGDKMNKLIATALNGPMQLCIKAKKLSERNGVFQLVFDQFAT